MADLSPTAANVIAGSDAITEAGTLGATVVPGDAIYKDSADGLWKLADADGASALIRTPTGIALNGGASGQPVKVLKSGSLTLGAILTAGVAYYLSNTAGKLCPVADIGTGEYACFMGIATSTSVLKVNITPSGVAL
jgi:hypothetical protein